MQRRPSSTLASLHDRYRRWGAELPGGDLVGARGISMDGWFWRLTEAATGRVVIVLAGINTPRHGDPWGVLGLATEPDGLLRLAELPTVHASRHGMSLVMEGEQGSIHATRDRLEVRFHDVQLAVDLAGQVGFQGPLGASSIFQVVPGMNQYWHCWLLGGRADGRLVLPGGEHPIRGAELYAEKNWGRGGFPTAWWWGQSQGFDDPGACLAFAGGAIHLGRPGSRTPLRTELTGLVLRTPDGEQVRLGNPGTSPVRARVGDGQWRLRGRGHDRRGRRVRLEVDAELPLAECFVLPVPLVEERRLAPAALEGQHGRVQVRLLREGRVAWQGSSTLAGLELGGRELAEAELARRGGRAEPA